jgi:predicted aldo/keto reductase-like oxidoreductase
LRWVWDHPEVTVVLSGMSDETQIEENLATAAGARAGSLTAPETELVARAGAKYREIMKVECTGCGYCLPCPSGVDIPSSFDAFNVWHTLGKPQQANFSYIVRAAGIFTGQPAYASLCSRCMDCEEKCPAEPSHSRPARAGGRAIRRRRFPRARGDDPPHAAELRVGR